MDYKHFPADVISGDLLGLIGALLTFYILFNKKKDKEEEVRS